jgi:hypothetical protein
VGAGSEWIAASEGSGGFGSCKAHDVGICPQENRSRSKEAMGEGAGGEEGGVDTTRDRARASVAGFSIHIVFVESSMGTNLAASTPRSHFGQRGIAISHAFPFGSIVENVVFT